MARHRYIRSLDLQEEYENQYQRDSSDEESLSTPVEKFETCAIPDRSMLFDFIDGAMNKNHNDCYKANERNRKSKKLRENCEPLQTEVRNVTFLKAGPESKPVSNRVLKTLVNIPAEVTKTEDASKLLRTSASNITESRPTTEMEARNSQATAEYQSRTVISKQMVSIIVIGHVDAGKSTLFGNLLVKLGYASETALRKLTKGQKSTPQFAWLLDEMPEERRLGVTMDIASRKFKTSEREVVLLDAPGHKDFISNMITGATEADSAILVLDAGIGNFEAGFELGGQTKEHVILVRSLGISELIVAINKMDSVNWDEKRYLKIVSVMSVFLKSMGFKKFVFLPCSGMLDVNIVDVPEKEMQWFNGATLLSAINQLKPPERLILEPLRMFISDTIDKDKGVKASGRIISGYLKCHDKVLVLPSNTKCSISNILINDIPVNYVFAGDIFDMQITDIDSENISKGDVISCVANPIQPVCRFKAKLIVFSLRLPLTRGYSVFLHHLGNVVSAVVTELFSMSDKGNSKSLRKKPRFLTSNSHADVEITSSTPICLDLYQHSKELGRFLLRTDGCTIAAGVVTQIFPYINANRNS